MEHDMKTTTRTIVTASAIALMTAAPALFADHVNSAMPEVKLPMMTKPPVIDGVIHEEEWREAVRNVGFTESYGYRHRLVEFEGVFWVNTDGKSLFIAIKSEVPPSGFHSVALPDGERDVDHLYTEQSIELLVAPHRAREDGSRKAYHLQFNAHGAVRRGGG
jgi:hypothetical protein